MQHRTKTLKRLILILTTLLYAGCTATPVASPEATYAAIYLVQENGQLSQEDLKAHPEVRVTSSFEEFKELAKHKTTLWIDVNSTGSIDKEWLNQEPQRFFPIVLVGFGDALCSFRDTLGGFGVIEGPYADCSSPPPGFSVWMLQEGTGSGASAFMRGYEQVPTVKDILEKTDPLIGR